jgi:hypothetical protein
MEEEENYDLILETIKSNNESLLKRLVGYDRYNGRNNYKNFIHRAKLCCQLGDLDALKRIWEPDMVDEIDELGHITVLTNGYSIIEFLHVKKIFERQTLNNLIVASIQSGNFSMILLLHDLLKDTKPDYNDTIYQTFISTAIDNGHLRISKWILHEYSLHDEMIDLSTPIQNGYQRIVSWVFKTFPNFTFQKYAVFELIEKTDNINLLNLILNHSKMENFEQYLESSIVYKNFPMFKILKVKTTPNLNHILASLQNDVEFIKSILEDIVLNENDKITIFTASLETSNNEILLYLLSIPFINLSLLTLTNKASEKLRIILKERYDLELLSELLAKTSIIECFSEDINRIIVEYIIGTNGYKCKQYQEDLTIFNHP